MGTDIRLAGPADAETLARGLARLSEELGEPHRMSADGIEKAMAAPERPFRAVIAPPAGLALYSPVFSTVTGGAGAYISDLWVAPEARDTGLGRRLLVAAARDAGTAWGAIYLTLAVYDDGEAARGFYERLGFRSVTGQTRMMLDPAATADLKGPT